jgi:hypothetical protein
MARTELRIEHRGEEFDAAKRKLRAIAMRARDVSPAWQALLTWFSEQEFEQFISRGHRFGSGWAPLAESTLADKFKRGFPLDPLIRTGALAQSLTSRPLGVEHITPHEVIGGTDVDYAIFHQRGTKYMPRRKLFDPAQIRREQAATTAVANWIIHGRQEVGGRRVLRNL